MSLLQVRLTPPLLREGAPHSVYSRCAVLHLRRQVRLWNSTGSALTKGAKNGLPQPGGGNSI